MRRTGRNVRVERHKGVIIVWYNEILDQLDAREWANEEQEGQS